MSKESIISQLSAEDASMLGKSLENDMVYPTFSLIEILSPGLILTVIGLLVLNAIYQKYIIKFIMMYHSSSAIERENFAALDRDIRELKAEAEKLSSPHTFAQQALIKRKLAKMEPIYVKLAPKIKAPEKLHPSLYSTLSTMVPYSILLGVAIANRNVSLFRFTGSPDTSVGCISSIINTIGYPFSDNTLLTFSAQLGELFSSCTPLRILSSGSAGVIVWTIVIQRALNYITTSYQAISGKK